MPSQLDGNQTLQGAYRDSEEAFSVVNIGALIPDTYDFLSLTYVAAGNGAGEVETVTYKQGGSGGTTIAVLTLTYDASNRVSTVTRT